MIRHALAKWAVKWAKEASLDGFVMYCCYGPGSFGRAKGDLYFAYARLWAKIARAFDADYVKSHNCN